MSASYGTNNTYIYDLEELAIGVEDEDLVLATLSQKVEALLHRFCSDNLVIFTAHCQELGILHNTSFVEIKIFDLSFGWQRLVRNDAHESKHCIKPREF